MSSYIPGAGVKTPTAMLSNPIFPDIKKGPPRFIWSRKHWVVNTGEVQKSIQHIPQLQENAVLFQSRDYGSQHAYGKFSSRTQSVNKEFRPPMQDRDDFLPLSRIPRPVVLPRINPGGAFSSGNSVFAQQNMNIPGIEKYLTDRVKEGEIRPTFFAPTSMPVNNSILPDLELKLPATSASAGFKFPMAGDMDLANNRDNYMKLDYARAPVSVISGNNNYYKVNAPDAREDMQLEYNRPQTSAISRERFTAVPGLTPIDFDLDYNRPNVSVTSGTGSHSYQRSDNIEHDLFYSKPQVSASSGFKTNPIYNSNQTSVEQLFKETDRFDLQATGSQATPTVTPIYDMDDRQLQNGKLSVTDSKHVIPYIVPTNTLYQTQNSIDGTSDTPFYRQKPNSIAGNHGSFSTQGHIKRAGIDVPQTKIKARKGM